MKTLITTTYRHSNYSCKKLCSVPTCTRKSSTQQFIFNFKNYKKEEYVYMCIKHSREYSKHFQTNLSDLLIKIKGVGLYQNKSLINQKKE